ncbi:hypothetical protein Nepgr_019598 [Nepenthes gracilis]|uniref:Uncharacterized protein n=1 Tax=Nepenthes gracilis TaxID=150966 RepID=A0AAD3XUA0_NEPGR|nr:hypothetical protein Nepgr_019598 [Nepenthes gracilis]
MMLLLPWDQRLFCDDFCQVISNGTSTGYGFQLVIGFDTLPSKPVLGFGRFVCPTQPIPYAAGICYCIFGIQNMPEMGIMPDQ